MPNRIIKETICTSDTIDLLNAEEERLFYRLLVNADDFGRFDGRATVVLAACFPLRLHDISVAEVESWLQKLADVDLIRFYHVDGRRYLHFITWDKHQRKRAKHSKYPAPPTKVDAKAVGDDTPSTNGDAPARHDGDASPHGEHMTDTCPSRDGQASGARRPRNEKREYEKREARNETRAPEGDVGASIDSDSLLSPSEDLQKVVEHYHQVIGLLSPVAFQKLQFWLDEQGMEADVVCAAIDTTREHAERPGIAYLEGVLRNWRNDGVCTVADLTARERSPTETKAAKLAALFRQKADEMEAEKRAQGA